MKVHTTCKLSFLGLLLIIASICTSTTHARISVKPPSHRSAPSAKLQTALNILQFCFRQTIKGASHTKYFIQQYAIPSIVSISKAGYSLGTYLFNKIKQAYEARHTQQRRDAQDIQRADNALPSDHEAIHVQEIDSAPQSSAPQSEESLCEECCICFDPIVNGVKLEPCGHTNLCGQCTYENFVRQRRTLCPYCNQEIQRIMPADCS